MAPANFSPYCEQVSRGKQAGQTAPVVPNAFGSEARDVQGDRMQPTAGVLRATEVGSGPTAEHRRGRRAYGRRAASLGTLVRARVSPLRAAFLALSVVLYAAAMHYAYANLISPLFRYEGMAYRSPVAANYGAVVALAVGVALALPRRIAEPSDFVLWTLFTVAALPTMLVPQYADVLSPAAAFALALWTGGSVVAARVVILALPSRAFQGISVPAHIFWAVVTTVSALIYGYFLFYVGISFSVLRLEDIYTARAGYVEAAQQHTAVAYILGIQYNVLNPLFIIYGVRSKQRLALIAGIAGQLVLYAGTGYKSVLFSAPAILGVMWVFRRWPTPSGSTLITTTTLLAYLAVAADSITNTITWSSLFVRRLLVLPGIMSAAYVLVFDHRPKTFFSDSLFPWMTFPYQVAPAHIVGSEFYGRAQTDANASLFGHGFLGLGYVGILVECLALAALLWAANQAATGLSPEVSCPLFLMFAVSLANSSVFTVALTHGLMAAIVVAAMVPRGQWSESRGGVGGTVVAPSSRQSRAIDSRRSGMRRRPRRRNW